MDAPRISDLQYLTLHSREHAHIAYTYKKFEGTDYDIADSPIWLVFVNGLGLPQAFWQPTLNLLQAEVTPTGRLSHTSLHTTTYDRHGQGLSRPHDGSTPAKHDLLDSADGLHHVLQQVHHDHIRTDPVRLNIIIVAHSIGVPLTRLYLANHANSTFAITGALFLDSNMAHIDMASLLPDPAAADFDKAALPPDTTLESLRLARENYTKLFSPSAPNAENLDRSTLPALLPRSDSPLLPRPHGRELALTVVAHDPDTFAEESLKISPRGLTERFVEPAWREYNVGLLGLDGRTGRDHGDVVVATGAGHFVQRDNPRCVADEIVKLIERIQQ